MSPRLYSTSPIGALAIVIGALVVGTTIRSGGETGAGADDPKAPKNLEVEEVTATTVHLDWDRSKGAESYLVYRDGSPVATTESSRYIDQNLTPFTTYTYWVTAWDRGEESDRSETVQATTLDDTPPTAPAGLSAQLSSVPAVDLSWTAAEDPESGVAEYRVLRDGSEIGTSTTTTFEDTGIVGGASYKYTVVAVNNQGLTGDPSNEAAITVPDLTPPTRPESLAATAVGPNRIDLSWKGSSDPESGVSFYRLFRNGSEVATTVDTAYADSDLAPETTYSYVVEAVNGAGLGSEPSDTATATTLESAEGPPPPTAVTATSISPTQVNLSWTPPNVPAADLAGYNVYRDGSFIGTVTSTAWADIGLQPATTYGYRVSSLDRNGVEGERSAEVRATTPNPDGSTPPAPPTGLRVVTP